jgi:phage shock protein E
MKWAWIFGGLAILGGALSVRAGAAMPAEKARELLQNGALVVDVRTVEEFNTKHLTNAVNIPLNELKEKLPRQEPDKSRVLLLHCRSGRRSGMAESQLRGLGYTNAFNLGSFEQAENILNSPK